MKLEEIIKSLNIPFRVAGEHHHARSGWLQVDCPQCSPNSERFRLGINLQFNFCNCWSCGKLNLIEVLHEITKRNYKHLKNLLRDTEKQDAPERQEHTGTLKLPKGHQLLGQAHRNYLKERQLNPKEMEKIWGLRGYGYMGGLHWRILIPIHYRGSFVSWTARSIGKQEPRYISAKPEEESIPMKSLLFGEDFCRHAIIICEGPFDAMRIGCGAVATFGLSWTQQQLLKMSQYLKRIVVFDNELEAQRRANRLCDELSAFEGQTWNVQIDAKDPAEASKKEIQKLRRLLV